MRKRAMVLVGILCVCMIGVAGAGEINFTPYELDSAAPAYVKNFYNLLKGKLDNIKKNCECQFQEDV